MQNIISIVNKNNFIKKLNKELKKSLKRELRVLSKKIKLLPVIISEIDINLEDKIIEQNAEP